MNQSSSANGKKISSPDSSEVFDTSPSKTYHEQAYIDQTLRLREILKTLPAFAKDYFRAVEPLHAQEFLMPMTSGFSFIFLWK